MKIKNALVKNYLQIALNLQFYVKCCIIKLVIFCCTFEKVNFWRCKPPNNDKEDLVMMKRSYKTHLIICIALGIGVGSSLKLTVQYDSILCGVACIIATAGLVLNLVCGYDKDEEE